MSSSRCWSALTLVTGGSPIGRLGAVAHVAVALLDAPPSVVAQAAGAAAVAGTTGAHPWRHLGPLLQVKAHAVDGQSPDASQEASLLGRCSSWDEDCRKSHLMLAGCAKNLLWRLYNYDCLQGWWGFTTHLLNSSVYLGQLQSLKLVKPL